MDERIFVKEQQSQSTGQLVLIVSAVILIAVGLGGIIFLLVGGDSDNSTDTEPNDEITEQVTEYEEDDNNNDNSPEQSPEQPAVPPTQPEPNQGANQGAVSYQPPSDDTKVHIYFPKSPETDQNPERLVPVLRDRPEENLLSFLVSQVVTGPNGDERNQGYKQTWSFSGDSQCDRNITYKFNITGSRLNLELCREFSGNDAKLFIESLNATVREATSIANVVVLTPAGNCLDTGDESCLN